MCAPSPAFPVQKLSLAIIEHFDVTLEMGSLRVCDGLKYCGMKHRRSHNMFCRELAGRPLIVGFVLTEPLLLVSHEAL